jgi:hypothetical protein
MFTSIEQICEESKREEEANNSIINELIKFG